MRLIETTKDWSRKILVGSGILQLAGRCTSARVVVLGYHSIQDCPELFANSIGRGIIHSTSVFESQMKLIARKYSPVSLDEVLLFTQGKKRLPRNAVAVTFDDGYRDNFEIAHPILRRQGMPAAFYLTSSWIGTSEVPWFCRLRHAFATTSKNEWKDPVRGQSWKLSDPKTRNAALLVAFEICSSMTDSECRATVRSIGQDLDVAPLSFETGPMMSWDQARKLRHYGHIVGSHTMTHPNVAHISDEGVVRKELVESKQRIEKELNAPVHHFSYPHPALNPQWTQRTMEITHEAGYQTAVTTTTGPVQGGDDPAALRRLMAPRLEGQFRWALERAFLGRAAPSRY